MTSLLAPAGQEAIRQYLANPAEVFKTLAANISEGADSLLLQAVMADSDCCLHLCDERVVGLTDAIAVTRLFQKSEPHFEMRLARQTVSWSASPETSPKTLRALLILAEVLVDNRINPIIVQLSRSANPMIRSKVRGMIARWCPNAANVERYLDDDDPRVTANVLEMLANCGLNKAWVTEILKRYVSDSHNRVAANASVGLFRIGETALAVAQVQRMASDERPAFRSSAAWAMGEMPLPELTDDLHRLRQDADRAVRWNALRSLVRLQKRAKAAAGQEAQDSVQGPRLSHNGQSCHRLLS